MRAKNFFFQRKNKNLEEGEKSQTNTKTVQKDTKQNNRTSLHKEAAQSATNRAGIINMASQTSKDAEALSSLVEEVLIKSDSDLDFADDDLAQDMATSLPSLQPRSNTSVLSGSITGSITDSVGGGRRVSRASLAWFQRQTAENTAGLITGDGKLSDDYILQRQSVNRPAVLKTIPRLADLSATIDQVDGWVLTQMFLSGYAKLAKQVGKCLQFEVAP